MAPSDAFDEPGVSAIQHTKASRGWGRVTATMRFGTYYFFQAPPSLSHPEVVRNEMEQIAWTEELGFDSVWLTEHHFIEYGLSVSPALLAAAAAMRTSRVRIGLAAAILPFHDPIRLAEELAMVDILSGGPAGRRGRPREPAGGVRGLPGAADREPGAVRGVAGDHAPGLDEGAVLVRGPALPDP